MKVARDIRISDALSIFSIVISVGTLYFAYDSVKIAAQRQVQANAVELQRLYFSSYWVGSQIQRMKHDLQRESGKKGDADLNSQVKRYIDPIEFSLGIQSGLDNLSLAELENTSDMDASSPGYAFFAALEAKYDKPSILGPLYVGQGIAELDYAAGQPPTLTPAVKKTWPSYAQAINAWMGRTTLVCTPLNPKTPSIPKLLDLKRCVWSQWLSK
ncbi:MAG: hypothetical protein WAK16_03910 [Candidatus Cybelea sp.]